MSLIMLVDDEAGIRKMLNAALTGDGHRVKEFADPRDAVEFMQQDSADLLITDLAMPSMTGVELLKKLTELGRGLPAIVITAFGSKETAIQAMRYGAVNYLEKPFDLEEMRLQVQHALSQVRLRAENTRLRQQLELDGRIVGSSTAIAEIRGLIDKIGPTDSSVLVTGESGTGKELVARALHARSSRADRPFVSINCGAIPAELLESELFGHERGAFTGADRARRGLIETAERGTLFLDEIGDMPLPMQVKLLRVLQERSLRRVGGTEEIPVDVRLIAATHRDLEQLVAEDRFREDLYYRIHVIQIHVPALRDRREDIPELAELFVERHAQRIGRRAPDVDTDFIAALLKHSWPGNVRELDNAVERAVVLSGDRIDVTALRSGFTTGARAAIRRGDRTSAKLPDDIEQFLEDERAKLMESALGECGGVQKHAAERLGMTFRSFRYFAKKYGLVNKDSQTGEEESTAAVDVCEPQSVG